MNSYEQKQAARRDRYETMADNANSKSDQVLKSARVMGDAIPFGQPILVGHHSEGRDRRYRASITAKYEKGFNLMNKAQYYAEKAAKVGTGGISSDDPEAVVKLRKELEKCEKAQDTMKKANAFARKNNREGLASLGFSEAKINELLTPSYGGRVGFPPYATSNNNANIRRIKDRIEVLTKQAQRQAVTVETDGYTYSEDIEENRVMFEFDGKPAEAIRETLKRHGFKWSPTRSAWVRQLNGNGTFAASLVRQVLDQK